MCTLIYCRPLHDAVERDNMELVRMLLLAGADPRITTYSGLKLTDMAVSKNMANFLDGKNIQDLNFYDQAVPIPLCLS